MGRMHRWHGTAKGKALEASLEASLDAYTLLDAAPGIVYTHCNRGTLVQHRRCVVQEFARHVQKAPHRAPTCCLVVEVVPLELLSVPIYDACCCSWLSSSQWRRTVQLLWVKVADTRSLI